MSDIKFDGDVSFKAGQLVLTNTMQDKVRQRLYVRLKTFLGTWAYNLDYGTDYFGSVFGKGRTKSAVDSIMRIEIMKEKYVETLTSFSSKLVGRKYTLTFSVIATDISQPVTITLLLNNDGLYLTNESGNFLAL
jgi:hypothetical protein